VIEGAHGQRGSGVVVAVSLMAVAVLLGGVAVTTVDLLRAADRAQRVANLAALAASDVAIADRAQRVANLAALAASDVAIGVVSGRPCVVARDVARQQQMELDACEVTGSLATVSISLRRHGVTIQKRAAASPRPSGVWSALAEESSGQKTGARGIVVYREPSDATSGGLLELEP